MPEIAHCNELLSFLNDMQYYRKVYTDQLAVIKFGGALAEDPDTVRNIAKQVDFLRSTISLKVIVVHGGGQQIDLALKSKGIAVVRDMESGLRVTDPETLEISDASLRALNGKIVNLFHEVAQNIQAVGTAGYDGRAILAERYAPLTNNFTGHSPEIRGKKYYETLLACKEELFTPVIYPICAAKTPTSEENRINVNADDVASAIASQMGAVRLILCSDIPGVLDKEKKLITEISPYDIDDYITDGVVTGGMIPKLRSAGKAAEELPETGGVVILDGRVPNAILAEFFSKEGYGTIIRRPQPSSPPREKTTAAPK